MRSSDIIFSCILALGLSVAVAETYTAEYSLPPDMERLFNQRRLVVAMHQEDGAPFYMLDKNGRLVGLDVDLAHDIGRKLGLEVEFKRDAETFDEVADMVRTRKADVAISCLSRTIKRAIKVNFSTPYVRLHSCLLINRKLAARIRADLNSEEWLNSSEVTIGTVGGSSFVEYAQRDYPGAKIVEYESVDKAAEDLIKGNIYAVLYDDSMITIWADNHPEEMLFVKVKVLMDKEDPIAIAVHWQDAHLLAWLNIYLDTAAKDGTLSRLKARYLDNNDWKNEL